MKVGEVGRSDLRRFRDEMLEDGLSNSTVKIALANLSRMFNWAREEAIIDCTNPVALVEKPSVAGQADNFDFLAAARSTVYSGGRASTNRPSIRSTPPLSTGGCAWASCSVCVGAT